jgi:hypothetical protein
MKALLLLSALVAFLPAAAAGKSRVARCVVSSAGERPYSGPCDFLPEAKGSFNVDPVGRRLFFGEILGIDVELVAPGEAEVSGLTTSGINSRWGKAHRSRRDPACWEGEDFRICVY